MDVQRTPQIPLRNHKKTAFPPLGCFGVQSLDAMLEQVALNGQLLRCGTRSPAMRHRPTNEDGATVYYGQCGIAASVVLWPTYYDHSTIRLVQLVVIRSALAHANCDQLLDHIVEQFVCFSALLVRIPPADCVLYTVYSMSTL